LVRSSRKNRVAASCAAAWRLALLACVCGCEGLGWPVVNLGDRLAVEREFLESVGAGKLYAEAGRDDRWWVEVPSPTPDGAVWSYLSVAPPPRKALVVLLDGAATLNPDGREGQALYAFEHMGSWFCAQGYAVLVPALAECGSPYGYDDVTDANAVLDWAETAGRARLGGERVYVVGYSVGATTALRLAETRVLDGVACISPLTSPRQLLTDRAYYELLNAVFPSNEGFCQLAESVRAVANPSGAARAALDSVANVVALASPTLILHGTADQVFRFENAWRLQRAYRAAVAENPTLPLMEFRFFPRRDHFALADDPGTVVRIAEFFERIEAGRGGD